MVWTSARHGQQPDAKRLYQWTPIHGKHRSGRPRTIRKNVIERNLRKKNKTKQNKNKNKKQNWVLEWSEEEAEEVAAQDRSV